MKDFMLNDEGTFFNKKVSFMWSNIPMQYNWEIVKKAQGFILGKYEDEFCVMTTASYYNPKWCCPWVRRYMNKEDALLDFGWVTHIDMALLCNGM